MQFSGGRAGAREEEGWCGNGLGFSLSLQPETQLIPQDFSERLEKFTFFSPASPARQRKCWRK
jgi:hypothetical protein